MIILDNANPYLTPKDVKAFTAVGQRPFGTGGSLEVHLAGMIDLGEEGLGCLVEL